MSEHVEQPALPLELRPVDDALRADATAWQGKLPPPDRLVAFYAGLADRRPATSRPAPTVTSSRPMDIAERGSSMKRSTWWGGVGAVALVAALIVAFVTIFHAHTSSRANSPATTLPPTLHVSASQGWVKPAALSFGKDIAFSHSQPNTGYVCGNMTQVNTSPPSAPLRFTVTHDGGFTWHELAVTPATGESCRLAINPTDSNDVVMLADQPANVIAWRTHDGGQSWQQLQLPAGNPARMSIAQPVWTGSTLFVVAYLNPITSVAVPHFLAASVNGAPLQWVDNDPLFHKDIVGSIWSMSGFAIGQTYYAQVVAFRCPNAASHCAQANQIIFTLKTLDGGTSWSRVMFGNNAPEFIFGTLADGHTLFSQGSYPKTIDTAPVISRDEGQTWHYLPALPVSQQESSFLKTGADASAPDGTLFGWEASDERDSQGHLLHTTGPYTLLTLAPNSASWATTDHLPGFHAFAVSCEAAGHPMAVWSGTDDGDNIVPGIAYHAP